MSDDAGNSGTFARDAGFSDQTSWMLRVRDGRDRAAFAMLFDHYAPRIKGMIMRNGAGAARAEDVVQDVMLAVWHKAAQFDPERSEVSGWIYRIARNRLVDLARRDLRPLPETMLPEESTNEDGAQILALEQEAGLLRRAIARLSPTQREMIEKVYLGELTHTDICRETGLPLGTIKSRIRLGLERLRHELREMR